MSLPLSSRPLIQSGYAKNAAGSAYPELWVGLVGAWVPALGPTGAKLVDITARTGEGPFTNMDESDWLLNDGVYAVEFIAASSHRISIAKAAITKLPATMFVYLDPDAVLGRVFCVEDGGSSAHRINIEIGSNGWTAKHFASVSGAAESGAGSVEYGRYASVVGIFRSNTHREIWVDGTLKDVDTTACATLADLDVTSIGFLDWTSPIAHMDGRLAVACIWDRELSPMEIKLLAKDPVAPFRQRTALPLSIQTAAAGFNPVWATSATQVAGVLAI